MAILEKIIAGLFAIVLSMAIFNIYQISQLKNVNHIQTGLPTANIVKTAPLNIDVAPKGIPASYGNELGISYDDVSSQNQQKADSAIKKLGTLDEQISLSGEDLRRYIGVVSKISCEYCCGVESIIFSNGKPACGCAHSFAMRGLAKYLIKNHGDEYTDDEILEELGKWKTLFFPAQMEKKALVLMEKGIELNYVNLASNKYRDIEKSAIDSADKQQIDMTSWTEDEKMQYEHHGVLPARFNQNSKQTSQVGSC